MPFLASFSKHTCIYIYEVNLLKLISGLILGYIFHDAVQPTVVGKALDKVAMSPDLFANPARENIMASD